MKATNLSEYLEYAGGELAAAGIESFRVEAEMIVGHVLGLKRSDLYRRPERPITGVEASAIEDLVKRRADRVPLQYLLGECEFMSLVFKVRQGVFIPRPETESLVEVVIERIKGIGEPVKRVLDIGTGSGVIGISLAEYLKPALLVATDISRDALEMARENAILNRVETVTRFVAGDRLGPLRQGPEVGFDVVVCNPPYVETGEIPGLEPEVRVFEPVVALDGGHDGLRFIDGILPGIPSIMEEGGLVAFEIGNTQGPRVEALFGQAGLTEVEVVKDLAGLDRIVLGRRT